MKNRVKDYDFDRFLINFHLIIPLVFYMELRKKFGFYLRTFRISLRGKNPLYSIMMKRLTTIIKCQTPAKKSVSISSNLTRVKKGDEKIMVNMRTVVDDLFRIVVRFDC